MSSTDNKEHGELEQRLWQRFQDAEAIPGPEVWSRVDHALTMAENEKYKKRVFFYRQLAAACFILFILAGSALVLHYKHDQEQALLAATAQKENSSSVAVTNGSEVTLAGKPEKPVMEPQQSVSLTDNGAGYIAQQVAEANSVPSGIVQPAGSSTSSSSSSIAKPEFPSESITNTVATSVENGLIAGNTTENTADVGNSITEQKSINLVPAAQAIANVPDDYTSQPNTNPLLRRNAVIGTITPEDKSPETIVLQKQAEVALALNIPIASDKEEKTSTNSRWNVGMAYGSSYFNQNIAIPGNTVTPRMSGFGVVPDPTVKRSTGPAISEASEENMKDARTEFQENTQAATSFNVDVKTGFKVGKRLKLLAGVGYSQNTSKTKTSYIVEQFLFKPRTNERYKLQPTTIFLPSLHTFTTDSVSVVKTKQPFDVNYSYQMLSVPVGLQVEGNLSQKWFWYAAGSMAANFLMQSTIKSSNPEVASVTYGVTDDSPFRKVQFSGNMGAGLGKRLTDAVNISFGPEFRTFFNSMLTDDKAVATQGRPYTIGLNMGINYTLGVAGK